MTDIERYEFDVVVVGSGGAGCTAAIEASRQNARTAIISKGPSGRSGATLLAGADLMLDGRSMLDLGYEGDSADSPEKWAREIAIEGFYLGDQGLVDAFVREAPARAKDLIEWGMKVQFLSDARSIITTGPEICKALRHGVSSAGVTLLEPVMVTDLVHTDGRIEGVAGIDLRTGKGVLIKAASVVLATGGIHQLFPFNSGSDELSGDGQGLAYRIGADLVNMEFITFCPVVILSPPKYRGSIFTYIYKGYAGMELLDRKGHPFLFKYDPEIIDMALNSEWDKLVLSQAIAREIQNGRGTTDGGVWFSVNSIPKNIREGIGRKLQKNCWQGTDYGPLLRMLDDGYAIEVAPAAHYFEGGVYIGPDGGTTIPGLYAAGECAAGVFGANRVSAATTEMVVEGCLAGASAAQFAKKHGFGRDLARSAEFERFQDLLGRSKGGRPSELKERIQRLASECLWVIRDGDRIGGLLSEIPSIKDAFMDLFIPGREHLVFNKEWITALELNNLIPLIEAIARSALKRKESRGVHYRKDFPMTDFDEWNCNIIIRNVNGTPELTTKATTITCVEIPKGKADYLESIRMAIRALKGC